LLYVESMKWAWGFLFGLSMAGFSTGRACAESRARASDPDEPPPTYEPEYLDYRYQLLASDVVSVGLFATALAVPEHYRVLAPSSLGVYLLVPPVVHIANGQPARGGASLGLRVGFPIAGMPLGLVAGGVIARATPDKGDALPWLVLGIVGGVFLGGVAAMVVDDAFLGKVALPRDEGPRGMTRPSYSVGVLPFADPRRKAAGMSLVGTF
jgi:hypothetical protein